MASLEQSRTKLAGEADLVQKKAFTKWINSHLEKAGLEVNDLFEDLCDGTKLLTLLELFTGKKMPREKGNMRVHHIQNVKTAINYLTDVRKIRIVGIPIEEIVDGNKKLTLGLVWMLILNFQLSGALPSKPGQRPKSPMEVSAKEIKKELLQWAKAATEGYEEVNVTNFHRSWNNGLAFCAIINRHRPDLLDYDDCLGKDPLDNFETAFSTAEKELGVIRFLDPEDVNVETPSEEAVLIYVSALRQVFPDMPPPHRRKGPPVSPDDYRSQFTVLKDWLVARRRLVANRDFPSTADGLRVLLKDFTESREAEEPDKEKELQELKGMEGELRVFAMKRKKDIDIPDSKEIEELWSLAISESDEYQSLLKSQLDKLVKRDELVQKVLKDIEKAEAALDAIGEEIGCLETESVAMEMEEVTEKASDIKSKLKSVESVVKRINDTLNELKELGYTDTSAMEEKLSVLQKRLADYYTSLQSFLSSADESQLLLTEADAKLRECEKWLIINGKFAENQLIIEQTSEYQSFKDNELAEAAVVMEKVNSIPLIGIEDKVDELNKRWNNIQEQLNSRLSKLEAISQTVSEFDSIKNPLEAWCLSQQEVISSLPLLDTNLEELEKQRQHLEKILHDIETHKDEVDKIDELTDKFSQHREPVQSSADKFARRLKRLSSQFSVSATSVVRDSSEGSMDMSLYEQSGVLRDQWERYKSQVEVLVHQASDLHGRLLKFEELHSSLRSLIEEGQKLLESERPVGNNAERIAQQTSTCQSFRQRLTDTQSQVDSMLSLGRSIIGEHYTNPHHDSLSQTLTRFIQDWSNLLLAWQNWYDELHATGEQSQNLSDQFDRLKQTIGAVLPEHSELFPACVSVDSLIDDLKELQETFNKSVYEPVMSQRSTLSSLLNNTHLLSNKEEVELVLKEFNDLMDKIQSQGSELSDLIDNVNGWWAEFETARSKVAEMREELTDQLPLGGSSPYVMKQDEEIQSLFLQVEERKPKVQRSFRNLTSVADHTSLLEPHPLIQCRDEFQEDWKELYEQVERRRDLVEVGRVRLSVYIECRDPFDSWLDEAEKKLSLWQRVDTGGKDHLVEQTESLKAFRTDVELHSHDLQSCTTLGDKFLDTGKEHQRVLLSYKHKLHPPHTHSRLLPEGFYDWDEGEGLKTVTSSHNLLKTEDYNNGLLVIRSDVQAETKRYNKLKGRVSRRTQRYEEAREKRLACEEAMEAVLPKLNGAESLVTAIKDGGLGKNSIKSLREQLEMMESLESEFSELRYLMDPLHMSVAAWSVREPTDSEREEEEGGGAGEEDECVKEKEAVQERYEHVQESLRLLREELESSLAEAQAFQSAYSSFVSWLRDTERKIQRDNQLKLEVNDLKSGLAYLKAVSADISGHQEVYTDLCGRFHTVLEIMKGGEREETEEKLDNLVTRWTGLQVISEDIEVISEIIPQLESFYTTQRQLLHSATELLEELTAYSPSTNTTEGAEKKKAELQLLSNKYTQLEMQFDSIMSSSTNLTDTLFDQTKFQNDVSCLREKLKECKTMRDEKLKTLKHITSRLKSLEVSVSEYENWLTSSEEKISTLVYALSRSGINMSQQLKEVQLLEEDITEHEGSLDSIDSLITSLSSHLDETHSKHLQDNFQSLSSRYRLLSFSAQAYPVEVWLQTRYSELYLMRRAAVLTLPLTTQVHEATRFQNQIDGSRPRIEELEGVVTSLSDQSELSSAKVKLEHIQKEYDTLKKLTSRRCLLLGSFLPRIKLYEGSVGNWEELLSGWEESAASLAPPTANLALVQSQIETIKSLLVSISDHEPEFSALLREAVQLYSGPDGEEGFMDEIKGVCPYASPVPPDDTRQGQTELQGRLDDDKTRLDNLKRSFSDRLSLLSSLSKNLTTFTGIANTLLPWLQEQASVGEGLILKEPSYKLIQEKLATCQALTTLLGQKSSQKDEAVKTFQSIASVIPPDDPATISLQGQLDTLQELWSNLSDQLKAAQSRLEPAGKLARSYEKEKERLSGWVRDTLGELSGLKGFVPTEPDAIQELKIRIDSLKTEYNSYAPMLAQCTEEGLELSEYVQDPVEKEKLTKAVQELQSGWDNVGQLLSDIHQKLTEALLQTQEFQQVADNLERWVNATQTSLKTLEPVAAQVRLIEPQIEGFKPILEDIKLNATGLEQVKAIGNKVVSDSTTEERLKVEKRLHALETRFYGLDKIGKARMSELQDAHTKAGIYESHCSTVSNWIKTMEEKSASLPVTPIRSQPLSTLCQDIKVFNQSVSSQSSLIDDMTGSECTLFAIDFTSLGRYDDQDDLHLLIASTSPQRRAGSPLQPGEEETLIHPDFVKRPGAVDAIDTGAKLRQRYKRLRSEGGRRGEETERLLQTVRNYEANLAELSNWLNKMVARQQAMGSLPVTSETMKQQITQIEEMQSLANAKLPTLESINSTGTSLVDGCHDDLSRDSVRESLAEVNERWGDLLKGLEERSGRLREGVKQAEKYEAKEREMESWLSSCEEKLSMSEGGVQEVLEQLKSLQSDVLSKKSLLSSTVSLGESLQEFISSGSDEPVVLKYTDLQHRYDELSTKLTEKLNETEASLSKATGLKSRMLSLCDQLKAIKSTLDSHEPPRLLPDLIKQQLQELQGVWSQWSSLQPVVIEALKSAEEYSKPANSEMSALSTQLSSLNNDVQTLLEGWKSRLEGVLERLLQFESDHKEFSGWMNEVSSKLGHDEPARGTVEGVKLQIEGMEYTNSDISQHQAPLQQLMNSGRGMMGGASPNDCVLIGDRLAQVQSSVDSLQRTALTRTKLLKDGLSNAEDFHSLYQSTLTSLQSRYHDNMSLPPVGTDIDTVKAQLEDLKEFDDDLQELKSQVSSCNLKGTSLKKSCHHDDHKWVDSKLEELNSNWSKLQSSCVSRQQELENALLRLGQFHEALAELLLWFDEADRMLVGGERGGALGVSIETLESQMKDLQALQSEIVAREPTVVSLNEAGNKLIATSTDETAATEIKEDVNKLNIKWDSIKSLSADKQLQLSTALERARCFHGSLKTLSDQLEKLDNTGSKPWTPHGLPDTCEKDLNDHIDNYLTVLRSLKETVEELRSEGEGLKGQGSDIDCDMIDRWISDIDDQWVGLLTLGEEKEAQLEEAKTRADKFDDTFKSLSDQLDQLEKQAEGESTIMSEAEAVKEQLEKHNEFLKSLDEFETRVKEAEIIGKDLIKSCVKEDGTVIKEKLSQLRSRTNTVQSSALSQLSKLEEALLTLGEFEDAYSELLNWLARMSDALHNAEPLVGQSDSIAIQLEDNKVTQRELDARTPNYKSVIKAGRELMKSKQGNDKNVLKRKLADLEQEWNTVCQMCNGRQKRIEEAYKKVHYLESQIHPLSSWMNKVLSSLNQSDPVHGDIATVHELIDAHEAFQRELGAHQKSVDTIQQAVDELGVNETLDNVSPLKDDVDALVKCWHDLCQLSLMKQERLEQAKKDAMEFNEILRDVWVWLDEKSAELDEMSSPADEVETLQQQIEELESFKSAIEDNAPQYQYVLDTGSKLHSMSHPRAEPVLQGQLQQLQFKWSSLEAKMAARSDALSSNMLELHGLQEMLDQLSGWVHEAELSMGGAEDVPLGDDLESVEQQLADHESFQEEMAAYQPNMDALNKIAKRRKSRSSVSSIPAASSSQPDMSKRISSLYKKWQRLWLRSSERHRQLLEARTRLKDIAMARSFKFDAWCKKFVGWIDQNKLRVSDLFRRFDSNHDGMLTREEFMKGLKASGLPMNQIEMEKIADGFDANRTGLIDLSQIMAILKGQKPRARFVPSAGPARALSDSEKIDLEIHEQVSKCQCTHKFQVIRVGEGQYRFGDSQKLRLVRILRSTVMVRVGGGWEPLQEFLMKNDPCRSSGRTNTELRELVGATTSPGLANAEFRRKTQTAINIKNEAFRRASAKEPDLGRTSKAPHSGRQETIITKRGSVQVASKSDTRLEHQPRNNRSASTFSSTDVTSSHSKIKPPRERTVSPTPTDAKVPPRGPTPPGTTTPLSSVARNSPSRTSSSSKIPLLSSGGGSRIPVSKIPTPSRAGSKKQL